MRNFRKIFNLNLLYILMIAAQIVAIVFLCLYTPTLMLPALSYAAVWAVTLAAAVILLASSSPSDLKCAHFFLFAVIPPAGAVIYLLFRRKSAPPLPPPENYAFEKAEYFCDGQSCFRDMFSEFERAKVSIYIEFFIISDGELFKNLTEILKKALSRGVKVKIVFDGFGSAFKLRRKKLDPLKKAGAEIKVFHRLAPFPLPRLNVRDHRKIVVIDDKTAYTGGLNLGDEYVNLRSPYGYWKDTAVKLTGEAAAGFAELFLSVWNGKRQYTPQKSGDGCLVFSDGGRLPSFVTDEYAAAIFSAKERVHIFTPYFCPPEILERALASAARRGADVKIILPHIPDKKYAYFVSKACAGRLAASGVKFYAYTPGFMHAKSLVADGAAYIGSYNFDYRSTCSNLECGVKFTGGIAEDIERDFCACLALSHPLPPRGRAKLLCRIFGPLL